MKRVFQTPHHARRARVRWCSGMWFIPSWCLCGNLAPSPPTHRTVQIVAFRSLDRNILQNGRQQSTSGQRYVSSHYQSYSDSTVPNMSNRRCRQQRHGANRHHRPRFGLVLDCLRYYDRCDIRLRWTRDHQASPATHFPLHHCFHHHGCCDRLLLHGF